MSYRPIIITGTVHFVGRADILFTFCGCCHRQLSWRPRGGAFFYATCCEHMFIAEPMGIDLANYTVIARKVDMKNVRRIKPLDIPRLPEERGPAPRTDNSR